MNHFASTLCQMPFKRPVGTPCFEFMNTVEDWGEDQIDHEYPEKETSVPFSLILEKVDGFHVVIDKTDSKNNGTRSVGLRDSGRSVSGRNGPARPSAAGRSRSLDSESLPSRRPFLGPTRMANDGPESTRHLSPVCLGVHMYMSAPTGLYLAGRLDLPSISHWRPVRRAFPTSTPPGRARLC
jgi:hypothetical protein